jgi:hypothetical protein
MQLAGAIAGFLSFSNSSLRITLALCDIEGDADIDGGAHANWGTLYFAWRLRLTKVAIDAAFKAEKNGPPYFA